MILAAYGITGIGVVQLGSILFSLRQPYGVVNQGRLTRIHGPNGETLGNPAPIIFMGVKTFLRNHKKFKKANVVAFVLDSPLELSGLGIPLLGVEALPKQLYSFTTLTDKDIAQCLNVRAGSTVDVIYKPINVLKRLVASNINISLLSPIQTFIYTIKNQEQRKKVNNLIKTWFTSNELNKKIETQLRRNLPEKTANRIILILTDPRLANLKLALAELEKDDSRLILISKKYKVSTYDLRYMQKSSKL